MSILANPPATGRPMLVLLPGVTAFHARAVEASAFRHGRAGVGHVYFTANAAPSDANSVKVWRMPSLGDPGQPTRGFDKLVPLAGGGLADHIATLAVVNTDGSIMQALFFPSLEEGQACQAEISALFGLDLPTAGPSPG